MANRTLPAPYPDPIAPRGLPLFALAGWIAFGSLPFLLYALYRQRHTINKLIQREIDRHG